MNDDEFLQSRSNFKKIWLSFPFRITFYFPADGCYNYSTLSEADRKSSYVTPDQPVCDNLLPVRWYRFEGDAGTKMPTTHVPRYRCNAAFSGWMNGVQPTIEDGEVIREVCFTQNVGDCKSTNNIKVKNCGSHFIYKLFPVSSCDSRYCGTDWT